MPGRFIVTLPERIDPRAVAREHGADPDLIYTRVLTGFAGQAAENLKKLSALRIGGVRVG